VWPSTEEAKDAMAAYKQKLALKRGGGDVSKFTKQEGEHHRTTLSAPWDWSVFNTHLYIVNMMPV
jgi:hypothetical protein